MNVRTNTIAGESGAVIVLLLSKVNVISLYTLPEPLSLCVLKSHDQCWLK